MPAGSSRSTRPPTPSPSWSRRSTTRPPTGSRRPTRGASWGTDEAGAYLDFGLVFLQAKRYDQAIKAFERGLVYDPDHPQLSLQLAETLEKAGKGDEALAVVERYLKRQPQGVEGYELLAKVLKALKREAEITPRLEQAAKVDSKNVTLQYALADRYRETGQLDKAEALYKTLLTSQPTAQGYGALSASLLKRKKTEELLKVVTEALTKPEGREAVLPQLDAIGADPAYAEQVLEAGIGCSRPIPPTLDKLGIDVLAYIATRSNKLEKLIPIQRLALKQNPSPRAYLELTKALLGAGKFAEGAATLEELMAKYPDEKNARQYVFLGKVRRAAGQNDAALDAIRQALKLDPNDAEAQLTLCLLLAQAGKMDEAIEIAKSALTNDPANPEFNRVLGGLLTQAGKEDEALALYKGLLEKYPNNEAVVHLARSGLSVIYVNRGDFAKGEAELEALLEREPEDAGVNNDLGYLYADQGKNLEKAEAMIRKAIQEEPENPAYLDSLGWVLFKRGKAKEAVGSLEKAVSLPNGDRRDDPGAPGRRLLPAPAAGQGEGRLEGRRGRRRQGHSRPTNACRRSARRSSRSRSWARRRALRPARAPDRRSSRGLRPAATASSRPAAGGHANIPDLVNDHGAGWTMAGHSHSANIAHRKGTVDAKRGKLFSKLCRAIFVAARNGGGDPDMNLRLRYAIDKARSYSCPKDNIERSIKKATGELGAENFEEVTYEGYGPAGVAVLCEVLTDNRNRTAGELRRVFEVCGGNLGASGCVSYLFDFKGLFLIEAKTSPRTASWRSPSRPAPTTCNGSTTISR